MTKQDLHMKDFKPNAEVVIVTVNRATGKTTFGSPLVVMEFNEENKKWYIARVATPLKHIALVSEDGLLGQGMYPSVTVDKYVSANPEHVKNGYETRSRAQKERDEKAKEDDRRLSAFHTELVALQKKHRVEIYPIQTNGDDQGVELELEYSLV